MTSYITHIIEAEWKVEWGTELPVGTDVEITVELGVRWASNGIGAYEFWGQKCFDSGDLQPEEFSSFSVESVAVNGQDLPGNPSKELCDFAETFCDEMFDTITDGLDAPEPDYPEFEHCAA